MKVFISNQKKLIQNILLFPPIITSLVGVSVKARAQDVNMNGDPIKTFFIESYKAESNKTENSKSENSDLELYSTLNPQVDLSNKPIGHVKGSFPIECQPRAVEDILSKQNRSGKEFALIVQGLFTKCQKYWNKPEKPGLLAILDFMYTVYNINSNPLIHSETIKLRDGSSMYAYFAVRDKEVKRPWVIVKCGVFCTVSDSSSTANFLINLFDQAPFNVIFLSNRTGTSYIKNNESLTMAGHLEVHDLYEVGRWLKEESSYQETVGSIHALGISLGGNSALMVDPLAEAYGYNQNKKLFSSVMAICPVVNIKETMGDMFANNLKGVVFSKYTWSQLQESKDVLTDAQDYLGQSSQPPNNKFPKMLAEIVSRYSSRWAQTANQYRSTKEIYTPEDFWSLNQFKNYSQQIHTPYLVWASKDDMIVNNKINTNSLYNSKVYSSSSQLGVVNVDLGNHCGFATSYGYPVVSSILKSFILNHSGDFIEHKHLESTQLKWKKSIGLSHKFARQWWTAHSNKNYVSLSIDIFKPWSGVQCRLSNFYDAPKFCFETITQTVNLKDIVGLNFETPTNESQALILSRNLNGMLRVTSGGKSIEGTSLVPNQVEWYSY